MFARNASRRKRRQVVFRLVEAAVKVL